VFGLLLSLFACDESAPTVAADAPLPVSHLPALKEGLNAALLMWQGAQPEQAQSLLEQAYVEHFEPVENDLRASGVDTLSIEYDFGRIGWRMRRVPSSRRGDAEELSGLLLLLESDIEVAFAALPAAPEKQHPPQDP
jgi:hypothetical protein